MAEFSISEHYILNLFQPGETFILDGDVFTVLLSGKPTCPYGEPKTDVYVLAESYRDRIEIKISFKQENAEFLENKTNAVRAEKIFGEDWAQIIYNATTSIADRFTNRPVVFFNRYGRTDAGSITLGWKFELLNVLSGDLSGVVPLTREQKLDVYAGTSLPSDKRDAYVCGQQIENSGIANAILFSDTSRIDTIQDAIDCLIPIEDYVDRSGDIYFACKALNYRSLYAVNGQVVGKYDGDRPLSVYIRWSAYCGHLRGDFVFDEPLIHGGHYAYENLRNALDELGVNSTEDFDERILMGVEWV